MSARSSVAPVTAPRTRPTIAERALTSYNALLPVSILHIYIATYEHLLSRCRYIRDVAINGLFHFCRCCCQVKKGSPYSIAERRVPGLIPVLGSQHARDVSHKPGGRLP